ncbi:hypothetical protein KAR91_57180 [Candidatus Pacearchaeota archaeon]|nr:hypothetical protein [Candidatus Pacearchaeota archaeon]
MFNITHKFSRFLIIGAIVFLLPFFAFSTFAQEGASENTGAVVAEEVDENENGSERKGSLEGRGRLEMKEERGQGLDRRSAVANAVHELLEVADRSGGIGKQIRELAMEHNEGEEKANRALDKAEERGKVAKFFIGPNYKQLKKVEENLKEHNKRFAELEQLQSKLESKADAQLLAEQLKTMEQSRDELRGEMEATQKGFSLFGWLNRYLSK